MRYFIVKYFKDANGKFNEQAQTSNRVSKTEWATAAVVLDFKMKSVDKAVIDGKTLPKQFDTIVEYYSTIYPDTIKYLRDSYNS